MQCTRDIFARAEGWTQEEYESKLKKLFEMNKMAEELMSDQDEIMAAIEKIRDVYNIYGIKQGDFVEALADLNKKAGELLAKKEDKNAV